MICNSMSSEVVIIMMVAVATFSIAIANVRLGSSRPATQQKLSIGASFVRLESFKKGESFAPGGGH